MVESHQHGLNRVLVQKFTSNICLDLCTIFLDIFVLRNRKFSSIVKFCTLELISLFFPKSCNCREMLSWVAFKLSYDPYGSASNFLGKP